MRCRLFLPALAAGVALLLSPRELAAHDVSPHLIQLRPGTRDYILVVDPTGCHADITATSTNPNVAKVYAADMVAANGSLLPGNGTTVTVGFRVTQVFVVIATTVATSPLTASIQICWRGEDIGGTGPCQEDNCSSPEVVAVEVDPNAANLGSRPFGAIFGDPVATANGEFRHQEPPLLVRRGPIPLALVLNYSSRQLADGIVAGRLGPNWRDNFDWRLARTGNAVEVSAPDGRLIRFERGYFDAAWTATVGNDQPYDLIDHLAGFKLRDGRSDLLYTFDSVGAPTMIEDGKGNGLTLNYASGRLADVDDGHGRTLSFTYAGNGRMTQASDGARNVGLTWDVNLRLQTVTDPEGGVTTYAYDAAQPAQAWLTSRTLPEGNVPWTLVYDITGRVTRQIDAFGAFNDLAFDDATGKTTTTDALLQTQEHTHVDGKLTAQKFENGLSATIGSDTAGRRSGVTDRLGATTSFAWDAASRRVATVTEADGGATRLTWTPRISVGFTFHDLTKVIFGDGRSEDYVYDGVGNVTSRTDAAGGVWSRTYGSFGEILTATDATGGLWQYGWTANRLLDTATDPRGNVTQYMYDPLDRLIDVGFADGTMRAATWDDLDRMTSYTDEAGKTTNFAWDLNSNLSGLLLPGGGTWSFNYDLMDRVVGALDPAGNSASYTLDGLGRPVTSTNAAGQSIGFTWNSANGLAGIDAAGVGVTRGFDAEDVTNGAVDAAGGDWSFLSDVTGHLTRATGPDDGIRRVVRNVLGYPTQKFDANGFRTDYTYDTAGRGNSASLPGTGISASLSYDYTGRLLGATRGTSSWSYGRDAAGDATSFTDPNGRTTTATRDVRGRTDEITFPGALGDVALTWSFKGLLERALFSDGLDLNYAYDDFDRPLSAGGVTMTRDTLGRIETCNGISHTRDEVGRLTSMTLGPGMTVTYGWNVAGQLITVDDWLGGQLTLGYDSANRLNDRVFPNGVHESREYDVGGRLSRMLTVKADLSLLSDLRYEYDDEGQVTTARLIQPVTGEPDVGTATHSYDAAGQDDDFTFDELGRRVSDPWRTYTYDGGGRLTAATDWVDSYVNTWDDFGNLETITTPTLNGRFEWNHATEAPSVAKTQVNGVDDKCFVVSPRGQLLWSIAFGTNARNYYHFDLWGNTAYTTDDAAAVVRANAYSPNGKLLATIGGGSSYPFGEFLTKGEDFGVSIGVGVAFKERVWDVDTGAALQPARASKWVASLTATPYSLSYFPQVGKVKGFDAFGSDSLALEATLDPFIGSGRQFFRTAMPLGQAPVKDQNSGDPDPQVTFHAARSGWAECTNCHPCGLTANLSWSFLATNNGGDGRNLGGLYGGGFRFGGGAFGRSGRVFLATEFGRNRLGNDTREGGSGGSDANDQTGINFAQLFDNLGELENRRNTRRAILKARAFQRLFEFEDALFLFNPLGFLDGNPADDVMDTFDDLLGELEDLGVNDAESKLFDYLTDPEFGLGLRSSKAPALPLIRFDF